MPHYSADKLLFLIFIFVILLIKVFFVLHLFKILKGINGNALFFKMVVVRHLGFLKFSIFGLLGSGEMRYITKPNFLKISQYKVEI